MTRLSLKTHQEPGPERSLPCAIPCSRASAADFSGGRANCSGRDSDVCCFSSALPPRESFEAAAASSGLDQSRSASNSRALPARHGRRTEHSTSQPVDQAKTSQSRALTDGRVQRLRSGLAVAANGVVVAVLRRAARVHNGRIQHEQPLLHRVRVAGLRFRFLLAVASRC